VGRLVQQPSSGSSRSATFRRRRTRQLIISTRKQWQSYNSLSGIPGLFIQCSVCEECLNVHWFASLEDAQQEIDGLRWDYNEKSASPSSRGTKPLGVRGENDDNGRRFAVPVVRKRGTFTQARHTPLVGPLEGKPGRFPTPTLGTPR
jgi:hypothetical protein